MIYTLTFALLFTIATTMVLLRNRFEFKSIIEQGSYSTTSSSKVSICVPARNEELVIERCVRSLLLQNHPNFEVLVLDDNSTDRTPHILAELQREFKHLTVINGKAKPETWLGKPWACHQLSEAASGEFLIFVDADVWLEPNVIMNSIAQFKSNDAITIWPQQKVVGFMERLVVPTIYYALLTLLPAVYVHRSPRWMPSFLHSFFNTKFVAACGQFIGFKKEVYDSINGHKGVKNEVVEDMVLARKIKKAGFTLHMFNGINAVYCRMYTSSQEIWTGFQKNFLAGFNSVFEFLFMGILHFLVYLFPFYTLWLGIESEELLLIVVSSGVIGLYIAQRFILNLWFYWNWWMALLHPLAVIWYQVLAFKCLYNQIFGKKTKWKGRSV